jgi:hypothetical protein
MPSGEVIEILGSKIAKIENAGHRAQTSVLAEIVDGLILGDVCGSQHQNACLSLPPDARPMKIRSLQS